MSQPMPNNTGSNIVHLAKIRRLAQENNTSLAPKAKVLFVDDEERILNSLKAIFRMQYDVTVSTDGHHAIELTKTRTFSSFGQ
jgi:Response regulators consisting of a CheY-like receiver domain and a winged-helix DNA-binding domain